jgi:hypothetical protein
LARKNDFRCFDDWLTSFNLIRHILAPSFGRNFSGIGGTLEGFEATGPDSPCPFRSMLRTALRMVSSNFAKSTFDDFELPELKRVMKSSVPPPISILTASQNCFSPSKKS